MVSYAVRRQPALRVSEPVWGNGGEVIQELTLREKDGRWLIQSFSMYPVENGV